MGTNYAALGVLSRFGLVASNATNTTVITRQLVIRNESLKKTASIVEREGIRGTRTHTANDTRNSVRTIGGAVEFDPSPEDLTVLLPLILGGTAAGNSYPLAESLPYFIAAVDRISEAFEYYGCKIDRATFSGAKGTDPTIKLALEVSGIDELTGNASSFFGSTALTYTPPYIFSDLVFSLNGITRQAESFTLTIDNHLIKDRFMNQVTVVDLPEEDRTITLEVNVGFTTNNTDLYNQALLGAAGYLLASQAGTNYATNFQFSTLQVPAESPGVPGKAEIMLPLRMTARAANSGATAGSELTVVHVGTP